MTELSDKFAEIALNLPIPELFTYRIPVHFRNNILVGSRVLVPFRNKRLIGIVLKMIDETKIKNVKSIEKCLDSFPVVNSELLTLTQWVSDYYLAPLGETIHLATPPSYGRKIPISHELLEKAELYENRPVETNFHLTPTHEQDKAIKLIKENIEKGKFDVVLVYGVTSSGKTEIYLQSISTVLSMRKNALVLVPEIALTYQLIQRFRNRFGKQIAVLHSGMLGSERTREWYRIRSGEARVVIGVRSAAFAPIRQLGLIIVDEEHESTYKQDNSPRYHARDVAIMRARLLNATVILGSATPSLESYYHAKTMKYNMVELIQRIDNRLLPKIKIIDMRQEWDLPQGNPIISSTLQKAIQKRLDNQEQTILFLNRRGYASSFLCRACGYTVICHRCSVPLTFHQTTNRAHCHYCGIRYGVPGECPKCNSKLIRHLGLGIQQVENEIMKLFDEASISRLDLDITKKRGAYESILENFITGKTDILLGTQMIAKGIDIPNVTLVGVISADMLLNLSDFRSTERAYALLSQVSGRAGRGHIPGEVIIQTYNPSHYCLEAVLRHERHEFYERELKNRKKILFPPYRRLLLILIQHISVQHTRSIAEHFVMLAKEKIMMEEFSPIEILGPALAPIGKIKNKYRYTILFKGHQPALMRKLYQKIIDELPLRVKMSGVSIMADMDPINTH